MQRDGGRLLPVDIAPERSPEVIARIQASVGDPEAVERILEEVRFGPLERPPCANLDPNTGAACPATASHPCGSCKLVVYCSEACRFSHWQIHKRDCESPMQDPSWKPGYITERRPPSFLQSNWNPLSEFLQRGGNRISNRCPLWGNTPVVDIVKLMQNEKNEKKSLNLAILGARDPRHMFYTVAALPRQYSGKMTILVGDASPIMIYRNVIALLLLGTIEDQAIAVDVTIHFLYSAFYPASHRFRIQDILLQQATVLREGNPIQLGKKATLCVALPPATLQLMVATFTDQGLAPEKARAGYNNIRMDPSRRDFRDRMYSGLRPSHRVAFQEYRQFGIILPFGAPRAHFNWPNASLFDPTSGEWLLSDFADPLESYNTEDVIAAGKKHGATVEDIYGCLYFYLSDLLRSFKQKLDVVELKIALHSDRDIDLAQIPNAIRAGKLTSIDIPSTMRFDRVFVGNLVDANYIGLGGLQGWASLLARNPGSPHAVVLGYFMNWMAIQPDGMAQAAREGVVRDIFKKSKFHKSILRRAGASGDPNDIALAALDLLNNLDPFYDNNTAFREYLSKMGVADICRQVGLKRRTQHKVLPNRIGVPAGRPQNSLPNFKDEDHAYYAIRLKSHTWCERYIEFVRV